MEVFEYISNGKELPLTQTMHVQNYLGGLSCCFFNIL